MFERIIHLLTKEFIQMFRDPRMKMIIFVMPLVQVLVFSYAVTTDIQNVSTAVYDLDNTYESRNLINEFSYSKYFDIKYHISKDEEQDSLINKSLVEVVIHMNHGYAKDIKANKSPQIQIIIDGSDSNLAAVVLNYANQIMEKYSQKILEKRSKLLGINIKNLPKVNLEIRSWFNENLKSRNFYVPGVIALITTLITLLLTAMAIVREKEIGTMEQLIVSPISSLELILGKLLPFAIIGLIDVVLITTVGTLWFKIPMRGSLLLLFGSVVIYLLTTLGIGLFISTISNTQQEAMMSTFLFVFPAMLLSGFVFPIANMPKIIQYITYLNPLRYFLVILRGIFLKGSGISILWPQILVLLVMGLAVITMSSIRFHKRL